MWVFDRTAQIRKWKGKVTVCFVSATAPTSANLNEPSTCCAFFQGGDREAWPDGGWAVEGKVHLWLGLPPRHRGEDVCHWPHVCSGADEHDNHRLHAHLLQVQQRFQWSCHSFRVLFKCQTWIQSCPKVDALILAESENPLKEGKKKILLSSRDA